MVKLHVLLVFGGESSEHDISVASAHNVYAALDNEKYRISLCFIDHNGRWWLVDSVEADHEERLQLIPALGQSQFITLPEAKILQPDVIFPVLHGMNGEDGTVQGLAKLLHIPIIGPSVISAAITIDREITKRLLQQADLPVVEGTIWHTDEERPQYANLAVRFGAHLIIRPARAGATTGITKVYDPESFDAALDLASTHDTKILIEPQLKARDIEVAILGTEKPLVSSPGEHIVNTEPYDSGGYGIHPAVQIEVPAALEPEKQQQIKQYALEAYKTMLGHGMARVSFYVTDDGLVYINEIDAIPNFTNMSAYPKLMRHEGMSYPALIDKLIEQALAA